MRWALKGMDLDYQDVEAKIRANYRIATSQYRRDDEIEVTTPNHRRLGHTLRQVCRSFAHPINVLDVGCGTGRYFHCLENVHRLVGADISEDMLTAAQRPVLEEKITASQIELLRTNIYLTSVPPASFDFIYSLGMFGHGCPVTVEICNRFVDWLRPGGKILFNVVDMAGLPWCYRTRRRLRTFLYPRLIQRWQRALDEREQRSPFFALTKSQLVNLLRATRLGNFTVTSHACESPLWNGRHLECLATVGP